MLEIPETMSGSVGTRKASTGGSRQNPVVDEMDQADHTLYHDDHNPQSSIPSPAVDLPPLHDRVYDTTSVTCTIRFKREEDFAYPHFIIQRCTVSPLCHSDCSQSSNVNAAALWKELVSIFRKQIQRVARPSSCKEHLSASIRHPCSPKSSSKKPSSFPWSCFASAEDMTGEYSLGGHTELSTVD